MASKLISLTNLTKYNEQIEAKYQTKEDMPTKVSDFTNDSKYQTDTQVTATVTSMISGKADSADLPTKVSDLTNDAKYQTEDDLAAAISSVYKPAGSCAFADLPAAGESTLGCVYNVTNAFTTTADFVEGAGDKQPKGTNVVVVAIPGAEEGDPTTYKYDVLAGFVDLTDYAKSADYADVVRTTDIEEVTEAEILALFGTPQNND